MALWPRRSARPKPAGRSPTRWARRRGDVLAQWHLLEPQPWAADQGVFLAACGQSLGDQRHRLERLDGPAIDGRCPACQAIGN
jgi:hypothetical protein